MSDVRRLRILTIRLGVLFAALAFAACRSSGPIEPAGGARHDILFTTVDDQEFRRIEGIDADGTSRQILLANNSAIVAPARAGRMVTLKYVGGGHSVSEYGVYVARTDGTILTTMPDDIGSYVMTLSPDGSRIAYVKAGGNTLYVRPIDGSAPIALATGVADQITPEFSPDGRRIAFVAIGVGERGISIIDIDGTDRRFVVDSSWTSGFPTMSWSPDGRSIAYIGQTSGRDVARLVDLETGAVTRLLPTSIRDEKVEWSPDGRHVAIESTQDIWIVDMAGGAPRNLTNRQDGKVFKHPQWSPDGSRLTYLEIDDGSPNVPFGDQSLVLHDLGTGTTRVLAAGVLNAYWDHSR